jgi:hypothetical protein
MQVGARPVQPVLLPLPSLPNIVTVTPASEVSIGSEITVRPRKEVVGAITDTDTLPVWVTGRPSTVADAEIVSGDDAMV